jgi:predicted RNase H-like HicB family nuclease
MEAIEYTVILHWDDEYSGSWMEVPILPGRVSQGKTKDDALANIKEAMQLHLDCLREDGEPIPTEESYALAVVAR